MFLIIQCYFRCGTDINERERAQAGSDGVCWYCPSCKTIKSIRTASFFSKSKLTLQKWMIAMLWWSREYPVTDMAMEADIKWTQHVTFIFFVDGCERFALLSYCKCQITLGGSGIVVQVDESLFKHKPKVSTTYLKSEILCPNSM